jgi:hypothetical protein
VAKLVLVGTEVSLEQRLAAIAQIQQFATGLPLVAATRVKVAKVEARKGMQEEAAHEAHRGLAIAKQILAAHPYMLDALYVLADGYSGLGELSEKSALTSR